MRQQRQRAWALRRGTLELRTRCPGNWGALVERVGELASDVILLPALVIMARRVPPLPPLHYYDQNASAGEMADQVAYSLDTATTLLRRWREGQDKTEVIEFLAGAFRIWQMYEKSFLAWAGPVDWVQAGYDAQAKQERILEDDDPHYVGTYPPPPGDQAPHEPTTSIPDMPRVYDADELSIGELGIDVQIKVALAVGLLERLRIGEDRTEVLEAHGYAFRALQDWEDRVVAWAGPVDWVGICEKHTIQMETELEADDPTYVSPVLRPEEASDPEVMAREGFRPDELAPRRSRAPRGLDLGF